MSKVDTDQGLGPGSEPRRRELLDVHVDRDADTQPGVGKVEKRADAVDKVLDGFGPERPDVPRILPQQETTPPPEPVREESPATAPGKRQRMRTMVLASVVSFGVITVFGIGVVKLATNGGANPKPTGSQVTTTAPTSTTPVADTTPTDIPSPPTIATMQVEALPTVKTAPPPVTTARTAHSATAATTTTAPHATGTAPPGMSLLPDDPHR